VITIKKEYPISLGLSGKCKGSAEEVNEVGCENTPTHLQYRSKVLPDGSGALVAWCCECYVLEGGEDCHYKSEEEVA